MEPEERPPLPKKYRGPYKQYLDPSSGRPVPESTLRSRKKKAQQRDEADAANAANEADAVAVGAADAVLHDEGDPEYPPQNLDAQTEPLPPCDVAQHPADMADVPNQEPPTLEEHPQADYIKKYKLNMPLHRDFSVSRLGALLMILLLAIRHCHTESFVTDQIRFVNTLFGEEVLDISYYIFQKVFPHSKSIVKHYFCPVCEIYFGSEHDLHGIKQMTCHKCKKLYDVSSIDSGNFFITLSIREQIEALLNRPDIKLIDHASRPREGICDIFDGDLFTKCEEQGIPLENVLTVTFNTDGVRVHESTNKSMWPIFLHLNEIVPEQRFKVDNVILAGLYFGRSAPTMSVFMKPFMNHLLELSRDGVRHSKPNGIEKKCPVFPVACTVDSVAKPKVLCMRQFNGYCGCLYCKHPNNSTVPGTANKNQLFYDTSVSYPVRTEQEVISDMHEADQRDREGTLRKDSVNGFLGISVLLNFSALLDVFPHNTFHIIWSVVIDYMHCCLEGVMSDLLELYLHILDAAQVETLNKRITSVTPPQAMTRKPRPLSDRVKWKAKEFRSFLLYYSLPCLEDLLPASHFALLKLFVNSMHILLSDKISARALCEAKESLANFVVGFQRLYGLINVTYNLHLLTHLCDLVTQIGPLWCYSNFVFESCNGRLVNLVRGTRCIILEIAKKFTRLQGVPKVIQENPISDEVINFANDVMGHKYVKYGHETDGAFVTGSHSEVKVSDTETLLLEANNISVKDGTAMFYHRVISKGIVYYSKSYSKTKVYNDSCVVLSDGKYAVIDKIFLSSTNELVCLILPVHVVGSIIPSIKRCALECFDDPCVVPFKDIFKKCVMISFDAKNFICDVPNSYERD